MRYIYLVIYQAQCSFYLFAVLFLLQRAAAGANKPRRTIETVFLYLTLAFLVLAESVLAFSFLSSHHRTILYTTTVDTLVCNIIHF